jgi:L-seryl-tRNA(Ser) seleniumtransferase
LLLGAEPLVRRLLRHPLARALRVDKLTLAALEATLTGPPSPVTRSLAAGPAAVFSRAQRTVATVQLHLTSGTRATDAGGQGAVSVVDSRATVGGGGAPGVTLPSAAISLPAALAGPLRWSEPVRRGEVPAVVGRIERGRLLLDLRSVDPGDDDRLAAAIGAAFASLSSASSPALLTSAPPVTASPAAAVPIVPDQD